MTRTIQPPPTADPFTTERMLAAQRREQEELRCHAVDCGDFEHQAIDDMNARDLASAVNGLAAYLERIRAEAS